MGLWGIDKRKSVDPTATELFDQVLRRLNRLEIDLRTLEEQHALLQAHHEKLRSRFYGTLGAEQQRAEPNRDTRTRDWMGGGDTLATLAFRQQQKERK